MQKQHITLRNIDRDYLKQLLTKGSMKVRKQKRIQGLLYLDEGKCYQEVSILLSVNYIIVSVWVNSYKTDHLSFLDERPRTGRPIKFDGEDRAKVTALACSQAPDGHSRWSLRLLAEFLYRMEIILRLYLLPYNSSRPVVCFDECPCFLIGDMIKGIEMKADVLLKNIMLTQRMAYALFYQL